MDDWTHWTFIMALVLGYVVLTVWARWEEYQAKRKIWRGVAWKDFYGDVRITNDDLIYHVQLIDAGHHPYDWQVDGL